MPGFDGRGPRGMGPMTGRGRGFCAVPLNVSETEFDYMKSQMNSLKERLAQIEARIENLSNTEGDSIGRSKR